MSDADTTRGREARDSPVDLLAGDRRVALVLGAGGARGAAYHVGALLALWSDARWDARSADLVVGTSAGAVVGSILRMGVSPEGMASRLAGVEPDAPLPELADRWSDGGAALPSWWSALRGPLRLRPPATVVAALRRMIERGDPWPLVATLGAEGTFSLDEAVPPVEHPWPQEALWLCAVEQDTLQRTVFGLHEAANWADAVRASCAVPTIMRPVEVNGRSFVDGGLHSPTNADLLVDAGVDVAVVVSPMSGALPRFHPAGALMRVARRHLEAEVALLEGAGVDVLVVEPDREMRSVIGGDLLDGSNQREVLRAGYFSTGAALAARIRERGLGGPRPGTPPTGRPA